MEPLEKLKRRLNLEDVSKDPLLLDLLTDAEHYVLAYTGRDIVPAPLLSAVVELAAGSYNRLGVESSVSHSQGGVSDTFEGLPGHLQKLLDRYRVAKVGGG